MREPSDRKTSAENFGGQRRERTACSSDDTKRGAVAEKRGGFYKLSPSRRSGFKPARANQQCQRSLLASWSGPAKALGAQGRVHLSSNADDQRRECVHIGHRGAEV